MGWSGGGVDETRTETVLRRLRTIPPLVLGLVLLTALMPVLLVVGLVIDAVRWVAFGVPPTAARLVVFLWVYLAAEVGGVAALAAVWVASLGGRRRLWLREVTWRFQQLWAGVLFGAVRVLFGLRLEVAGDDAVAPGPVIVLIRHASIVDNLLPAKLVAAPAPDPPALRAQARAARGSLPRHRRTTPAQLLRAPRDRRGAGGGAGARARPRPRAGRRRADLPGGDPLHARASRPRDCAHRRARRPPGRAGGADPASAAASTRRCGGIARRRTRRRRRGDRPPRLRRPAA